MKGSRYTLTLEENYKNVPGKSTLLSLLMTWLTPSHLGGSGMSLVLCIGQENVEGAGR